MSTVMVYITTENREEAEKIGRMLVENRLAACANIIDGMRSVFWWQGNIDQAEETVLIVKTKQGLLEALTDAVVSVHSYDCPCVAALPIVGGNPAFIDWINEETQ